MLPLAIIGALLLLVLLVWLLGRLLGWSYEWLAPARHAVAEAAWRGGGVWSEFRDWLRFGH